MSLGLAIVRTGTANLASVAAAFRRLGQEPAIAACPEDVVTASRVVLPGVGSFGAAIAELDRVGMRAALSDRLTEAKPTLAICVGMQLLAAASEESEGARGLGLLDTTVSRFPDNQRVPQLGWNRVSAEQGCRFLGDGWAYFANSYRLAHPPPGWRCAVAGHGGEFVAGLERGDVLACQFHPELSAEWGSEVLWRWLGATGGNG